MSGQKSTLDEAIEAARSLKSGIDAMYANYRTLEAERDQARADARVLAAALDRAIEAPKDVSDPVVNAARERNRP